MNQGIQHSDNALTIYREKYKKDLMACLNSGGLSEKMFFSTEFNVQMINEFVDLYEAMYPERKQAFELFFCKTAPSFLPHRTKIKCMCYMLDEEIIVKMAELMKKRKGIYIQLFSHANPAPQGASAYFGRDFWGRPRIMYYDIVGKSQLHPPYKTFFHEFGHALDALMVRGWGFLSDRFRYTSYAESNEINKDLRTQPFGVQRVKNKYTKTIHQWAEFDVKNCIVQTAVDLLSMRTDGRSRRRYLKPEISLLEKYRMADFVVHKLFLKPDGCRRLAMLSGEKPCGGAIHDLYADVAEVVNTRMLDNYKNMIVLPRDLFGGITNNQLGGGHGSAYWFKGKRRVNRVAREAFAGYFEYKTTIPDPDFQQKVINPHHCMANTVSALEAMRKVITET